MKTKNNYSKLRSQKNSLQNRLNIANKTVCLQNDEMGLKDINRKSIYADSSIFEFIYKGESLGLFGERCPHKAISLVGYFTFNDIEARYEVDILNDIDYVCLNYDSEKFKDIKIIDTIQENKLGLIKG